MLVRDQAPWSRRKATKGWGEFTTEDAYRVALMHAVIRQGRGYVEAGTAVRSTFDDLVSVAPADTGDLLIGSFISELEATDDEAGVRLHLSFVAPQTLWFDEMTRVKEQVAPDDTLIAFSAVNATAVMRRTLGKAQAVGLADHRLVKLAAKVRVT